LFDGHGFTYGRLKAPSHGPPEGSHARSA
jgi:hypothetical protein